MTKTQTCFPSSAPSSSSKLGIGTSSHMISKFKPKIRIIHVYAPEIIKTDAANFRELVQRLTGKPEDEKGEGGRGKAKTPPTKLDSMDFHPKQRMIMEEEEEGELQGPQNGLRIKKEEEEDDDEIWGRSRSTEKLSGGFFEGFSELDVFMEELSTMPVV